MRFIPGQSRNNRSSTSLASRAVTIYDDDEGSPLLSSGLIPTRRQVSQWTNSIWKRQLVLLVLPVSIVSANASEESQIVFKRPPACSTWQNALQGRMASALSSMLLLVLDPQNLV